MNTNDTPTVLFKGHLNEHVAHRDIYELCLEIEKLPASEQQTRVVTLAGELQHRVAQMRATAAANAKFLRHEAAECFPEITNGQKHFARIVMEGIAQDLDDHFNPTP